MAPCRDASIYTEVTDDRITASVAGMIEIGEPVVSSTGPDRSAPRCSGTSGTGAISRLVKAVGREFVPCWGS